MDKVQCEHRN